MNRKKLLIPLSVLLLLTGCKAKTPEQIQNDYNNQMEKVEDNGREHLKWDEFGVNLNNKMHLEYTLSNSTDSITTKVDNDYDVFLNFDNKNIKEVYGKIIEENDKALEEAETLAKNGKTEFYVDYKSVILENGEKSFQNEMYLVNIGEGKKYNHETSGNYNENDQQSIVNDNKYYTNINDSALFFLTYGSIADILTKEDKTLTQAIKETLDKYYAYFGLSQPNAQIIGEIIDLVGDYSKGGMTQEQLETRIQEIIKGINGNDEGVAVELTDDQKVVIKEIAKMITSIDTHSFFDVSYAKSAYTFTLNYDKLKESVKTLASDLVIILQYANKDGNSELLATLGTKIAQFAVEMSVYQPTKCDIKYTVKFTKNMIDSVTTSIDLAGKIPLSIKESLELAYTDYAIVENSTLDVTVKNKLFDLPEIDKTQFSLQF